MPYIREQLDRMGIDVPLIGDFHYNGHRLLTDYPGLRRGAVEVPHQPGQRRQGRQARPPVRPDDRGRGALRQAGAHRRQLGQPRPGTARRADGRERALADPGTPQQIMYEAIIISALDSAQRAEEIGLAPDQIILSCKMSRRAGPDHRLPRTGAALRLRAAPRPDRSRHGHQGHGRVDRRRSRVLLQEGIGDTIRVSLTPQPGRVAHAGSRDRARDPAVARPALRSSRASPPARAAAARRARPSRNSPSRSTTTCARRCRSGRRATRASRR